MSTGPAQKKVGRTRAGQARQSSGRSWRRRAEAERGRGRARQQSVRHAMHDAAARELSRVRDRIGELLEPESPALKRYRRHYERALPGAGRPVARQQVVSAARRADVVMIGDYHTLPEAQRAALDLAMELASSRPIVLCLEMVRHDQQRELSAYVSGAMPDRAFLDAIDYERTWPFPWPHYRPLLDAARCGSWPVLAIDSTGSTTERDARAAAWIAKSRVEHPDALHIVLIGDLHLAPEHLPRAVERQAPGSSLVVIHQNEPAVYTDLLERQREDRTSAVVLGPARYCLLNATPLRRERSYLAWIEGRWLESAATVVDAPAEFSASESRLGALLGIDSPVGEWRFATGDSLDFLVELEERGASRARLQKVRREIVEGGRVLLPELELFYMRQPTVDDLAELAIEAIQRQLGEPLPTKDPDELLEEEFLADVRREALGFLGSCLLHPPRAQGTPGKRVDPLRAKGNRLTARLTREISLALEARVATGRALRLAHSLRGVGAADAWVVARRIGRKLGRRLFAAMVQGAVARQQVVALLAPTERRDRRLRERRALVDLARLAHTIDPRARRRRRPRPA